LIDKRWQGARVWISTSQKHPGPHGAAQLCWRWRRALRVRRSGRWAARDVSAEARRKRSLGIL